MVIYLFLPLAHSLARVAQYATLEAGGTLAFWGGDAARIVDELAEVRPTHFPSVPRIYEKVHSAVLNGVAEQGRVKQALFRWAVREGGKARAAHPRRGVARPPGRRPLPDRGPARSLQGPRRVRRPTGHRDVGRRADRSRGARVLRRLRRARARGLRHDRDLCGRDAQHPRRRALRVGRATADRLRGGDRRGRRGPDGRPARVPGLLPRPRGDRRRHLPTAGCARATSARSTRTATCTSPAARRTSSSPRAGRTSRPRTSRARCARRAGSPRPSWPETGGRTSWRC